MNFSAAAQIYPQYEYIFVISNIDARFALKKFPASKIISLNKDDSEQAYQMFMTHLDDLREVYESLIDEQSKKTFRGYWLGNISCQLGKIVYSNAAHYLIEGFIPERGAIAFDCGVLDGGTATIFAEMGYKVYGFEMDKISYEVALKVSEEKNFVLENLGLGSYKHSMTYTHKSNSGASRLDPRGTEVAQIVTIDSYVREKNLPSVDFIKMDVEGSELDILKGAKTSIARFKPILAISAYHKWDDFWTLMNFVKSIRSDYEFAMRQGYETPEEEPSFLTKENFFKDININLLTALGLEPDPRNYVECVLFAR